MDGMGSALQGDKQKQRKTPQEFLGANSNLVNLDDLVKTDTTSKKGGWIYEKNKKKLFLTAICYMLIIKQDRILVDKCTEGSVNAIIK